MINISLAPDNIIALIYKLFIPSRNDNTPIYIQCNTNEYIACNKYNYWGQVIDLKYCSFGSGFISTTILPTTGWLLGYVSRSAVCVCEQTCVSFDKKGNCNGCIKWQWSSLYVEASWRNRYKYSQIQKQNKWKIWVKHRWVQAYKCQCFVNK